MSEPSASPQPSPASSRARSTRRQKLAEGVSKIFGIHSRRSSAYLSASSSTSEIDTKPSESVEAQETVVDSTAITPLNPQPSFTSASGGTTPRATGSETPRSPASFKPLASPVAAVKGSMATPNGSVVQANGSARGQQVTAVKDVVFRSRQKLQKELRSTEDAKYAEGLSIDVLLDYIAAERLKRMPHQGSRYDAVLRYAEHFANQVAAFDEGINNFVVSTNEACRLIWASSLILLHMGHTNSYALERAFGVFYHLGLVLAFYLRNQAMLELNTEVRQELGSSLADLLALVTDVATFYKRRHSDMKAASVTIDFDSLFGRTIDSFHSRKDHVSTTVWMSQLQKSLESRYLTVDIDSIRRWLAPSDRTVRRLTNDPIGEKSYREEYTCEWFQKPLLDFLRSKHQSMIINGYAGSGKTILSDWIKARLQRPIGRRLYKTVSYDIDADILAESSSYSLVKDLLTQFLEQNVGDVALYQALANVYEMNVRSNNLDDVEAGLWQALDVALGSTKNLIITIDGLNAGLMTEQEAITMVQKLNSVVSKHGSVRLVILTRPLSRSPIPDPWVFNIERTHAEADIRHVVRSILASRFGHDDRTSQEKIIETTIKKSQGSFINAILTMQLLRGTSLSEHQNKLNSIPQATFDIIQSILTGLKSERTKLVLSWMLVAQRPLTVREVQGLLETDPAKGKVGSSVPNIKMEIEQLCGPLVMISDGIVRFRHVSIRDALSKIISPQNAESDLTVRALLYVKLRLTRKLEPSFERLESELVDDLFRTIHLLEYTTRYWLLHFRRSSMYKPNGDHLLSTEFKNAFPDNTVLPLLEGTVWDIESGARAAIEMHSLTLQVRQAIFGEKNESVIQTLVNIATLSDRLAMTEHSLNYYYKLVILSQTVLGMWSSITYVSATSFLKIVSTLSITTKGSRATEKERTLKYLVDNHKHKGGENDEMVIKYSRMLADLYVAIGEVSLAAEINKQIYKATVQRYGQYSTEATKASQDLTTVLVKNNEKEDLVQYSKPVFEEVERTLTVTDNRRVEVTIQMANTYESQKEYIRAEEMYITLWRKVTELARRETTALNHEKKIEVTLLYVQFLRRHKRTDEAAGILRGLWAEYEHEDITNETTVKQLKAVGREMNSLGLITVALGVFSSLWVYFKKNKKHTDPEAADIAVLISETTSGAGAGADRHAPESVLREVFESTAGKKVDVNTIKTCLTLSNYYIRREKWSEAIKVCQQLLKQIWPDLLSGNSYQLPKDHTADLLEIANRLATCYYRERKDSDAEKTYLYMFRSTKKNLRIQDQRVTSCAKNLIDFYMNANQSTKAVEVYESLLIDYRSTLGSTHTLTIETLYTIGNICQKYRIGHPDKYYHEIVESTTKGKDTLTTESMEAARILSVFYYDTQQWKASQNIFSLLWNTFKTHGKEFSMTAEFVETIYTRYLFILETHLKVEWSIIYKLTVEFRETCIKVFGTTAEITVKARLKLAEVCEKDEKHQQEAINIYEDAFKATGGVAATGTIAIILAAAKSRLARLYISNASSSKENADKAVTLYGEQFRNTREVHGSSHETTLRSLREMILLWRKQKTTELNSAAEKELKATTVEVVTKEVDTRILFDAAISIAQTYVQAELTDAGWEILRELRRQVIWKDFSNSEKVGFKIESSISRRIYVFIVAFEQTLRSSKTLGFSVVMASMLTEIFLYQRYSVSFREQHSLEIILTNGARLRAFLLEHKRQSEATKIEDEMFEKLFVKGIASAVKTPRQVTRLFFIILLEELGRESHDTHLGNAACIAGNERIYSFLSEHKFQEAFDLATCVFQFVQSHRGYHHSHNIGNGFKLSLYLAGRGVPKPQDQALHLQMIELSKLILRETLEACKHLKINFLQMQTPELNNLVALMGDQQNFDDLEWLLAELWAARHNTSWSSTTIVWIGRRLVEARFSNSHIDAAIHLCEDICYNLRRVWGPLDETTIEFNNLLSTLYASSGRYKSSIAVHEDLLRQEVSEDNEDLVTPTAAARAAKQIELLKRSYARNGSWDKEKTNYQDLFDMLNHVFGQEKGWKMIDSVDQWPSKGADEVGLFAKPTSWEFQGTKASDQKHVNILKRRSGSGAWGFLTGNQVQKT